MMIITRPQPMPRHISAPPDLPAPLDDLDAARMEARDAFAAARDAYLAVLPDGGEEFRAARESGDGKKMAALLGTEEPRRYAAWLLACDAFDAATEALVAAITPNMVDEAETRRVSLAADLEIALLEAGRSEFSEDAAGRLARAEAEIEVERLRTAYWSAFEVLKFLQNPRRWNRFNGAADASQPSGWPQGLSDDARHAAQTLTGARWSTIAERARR